MLKRAHIVSFDGYRSMAEFRTAFAKRRPLGQSLHLIVKMFAKRPVVCELCRDAIRGFSDAQAALLFEDEVLGVVSGTLICRHCTIDQTVADASMQRANLIVAKITNAAAEAKRPDRYYPSPRCSSCVSEPPG